MCVFYSCTRARVCARVSLLIIFLCVLDHLFSTDNTSFSLILISFVDVGNLVSTVLASCYYFSFTRFYIHSLIENTFLQEEEEEPCLTPVNLCMCLKIN